MQNGQEQEQEQEQQQGKSNFYDCSRAYSQKILDFLLPEDPGILFWVFYAFHRLKYISEGHKLYC